MAAGCPFITCAIKKKGVEFCWDCDEHETCEKWKKSREFGTQHDSFKSRQSLEHDINTMIYHGVDQFIHDQYIRELLLKQMLEQFNDGRYKSYYCIAATVMRKNEIEQVLSEAKQKSAGFDIKAKA